MENDTWPPLSQSHNGLWPLDVSPRADRERDRGGGGVGTGGGGGGGGWQACLMYGWTD